MSACRTLVHLTHNHMRHATIGASALSLHTSLQYTGAGVEGRPACHRPQTCCHRYHDQSTVPPVDQPRSTLAGVAGRCDCCQGGGTTGGRQQSNLVN